MATLPGFNPGMLLSEVTARAFCKRNGFAASAEYYKFLSLADYLDGTEERFRAITLARCDLGIVFKDLHNISALRDSRVLYWGDFLHMRQYVLAVSRILQQRGATATAEEFLLLANADPHTVASAVSFGTTTLFNSASDLLDPGYGPLLKALVDHMRLILVRDMVSAAQIAGFADRRQDSFLGLDAAQLVTLHDDWREVFGPAVRIQQAERGVGLAFFARSKHHSGVLGEILKQLECGLGVKFRWMPWGDQLAFPFLAQFPADLHIESMTGTNHPRLEDLMEAIASAKVVVTDTYHAAVTAWSLGTPAIMVEGDYWPAERDVNAGVWNARIDKRAVFFAQHSLLEFYLGPAATAQPDTLQRALEQITRTVSEGTIGAWHVAAVRKRAAVVEAEVASALND